MITGCNGEWLGKARNKMIKGSPDKLSPIDSNISMQIVLCRVFCIFFMTMVHLPPGIDGQTGLPEPLSTFSVIFQSILGRGSVSTLSLISGFLIVYSLKKTDFMSLAVNKFKALIIPMASWNAILISVGIAIYLLLGKSSYAYEAVSGVSLFEIIYSRILAVEYGSASDNLNFLRDIFVCALLAPGINFIVKRIGFLLIPILLLIDSFMGFAPIVMRGQILIFFAIGVFLANYQLALYPNFLLRLIALALFPLIIVVEFEWLRLNLWGFETIKRVVLCIVILSFCGWLAKTNRLSGLKAFNSSVFFIFLGHNVYFLLTWGAWQVLLSNSVAGVYLIYFLTIPVVWFLVGRYSYPAVVWLPAPLRILLIGK